MTRMYIQPSFVDSCSDHGEWSGGNGQYRGDRSIEVVPTYINGKPNVKAFSDEAIEARKPKTTKVSLKQRILPQASRLEKLNAEIVELENEYRLGAFSIEEYSMLRAVAFKRRDRAVELYKRAVKPIAKTEDEYEEAQPYTSPSKAPQHTHFPEQIATFSSNKACTTALYDAILFITGSAVLLIGFLVFF